VTTVAGLTAILKIDLIQVHTVNVNWTLMFDIWRDKNETVIKCMTLYHIQLRKGYFIQSFDINKIVTKCWDISKIFPVSVMVAKCT